MAEPTPVAQGRIGVEQFEPMTIEREQTSRGKTPVGDVEMYPMEQKTKAASKKSEAQAGLRALQRWHEEVQKKNVEHEVRAGS